MNRVEGVIKEIKSVDEITHIFVEALENNFSILVLDGDAIYQKDDKVDLLFKETEVMIASKESHVSARNSFVSPITSIKKGEILAQVDFDFHGVKIVSIITQAALYDLKCGVGDEFRWFVKSNEITLAKRS